MLSTLVFAVLAATSLSASSASRTESVSIRGRSQTLHLYGAAGAPPVIVTSGDGGWVHLGPAVAEHLAGEGFLAVGFDAKAYLSSFTHGSSTLTVSDVPADYGALLDEVARLSPEPPLLAGVSEGAGLSVLAATEPAVQRRIAGVVTFGLPDTNELGWRFRDSIIYITKKAPDEPSFSVREIVGRVSPVPLALLQSTHDEFVSAAESQAILARAKEPRRAWSIPAADHRFSDNQPGLQRSLEEAIAWIRAQRAVSR